ncbi:MAG: SDR family NAD(P)-dependent oxidoreductase [Gammaproteobacteria bacterium]|jgi:NAD(P)-dependent dehydrogenase (short-subunit alcohol dehydrogenase family)|nr:SDR family NAD(P)-dependent oxidoreductase [Gammaproteobacteria bacterium]MDP7270917.1 SDR family NAD(P)-dependent oxidoreductase [Gammaproteobacteria bacterium]HJP05571.1 SDR family NAD(P)-dependent oxidoreductase [Gammaproteobacteria bacterium]
MRRSCSPVVIILALAIFGISGCATTTEVGQANFDTTAPTVFIAGSSRGLGLEFARQYAARGWNVIATARRPEASEGLQALVTEHPNVVLDIMDVTKQADVERVAARFSGQPIDVLINSAGIWGDLQAQTFGTLDYDAYQWIYEVNALGPLRVTEALIENVKASEQKKVITLGGGMGTRRTVEQAPGGHYWYRMSRAANLISMAIVQRENKKQGIIIGIISPGKVDTRMLADSGWPAHFKKLSAKDSAGYVIEQIAQLTPEKGGELINYDGNVIGW